MKQNTPSDVTNDKLLRLLPGFTEASIELSPDRRPYATLVLYILLSAEIIPPNQSAKYLT